jgi:hypothetical protein
MSSRSGPPGSGRHLVAVPDAGDAAAAPAEGSALAQLAQLAARGASGELVCSAEGSEVHVFLQGGRIAWASSTGQRRAFTEHLKRTTGADDEVIEAVVAECSRTRQPIGEALIAWKVATAEQVRASLLHQIRRALDAATQAADARTLFLERAHYQRYDGALTFPLAEVLEGAPADAVEAPREPAAALAAMDGFVAAAVLSSRGEPLATLGDQARLGEAAGITHALLQEGQRLSIDAGAGLCRELHVEADHAHLLVYSLKRGPRLPLRIVLLVRERRQLGIARQHLDAVAADVGAGRASS